MSEELRSLIKTILEFNRERDWEKFHAPKNLVMDLASEVGELIEHFRWLTEEESHHLTDATRQQVSEEIGDVFKCLIYLCHKLDIDPVACTFQKIEKTRLKYPVEQCKGKAQKYTSYQKKIGN